MKDGLLDISVATSFAVNNFGNTYAMRLIFFSKYSEFNVDFIEAIKNQKKFLVLEISLFEIDAVNSPDPNGSTCNGQ